MNLNQWIKWINKLTGREVNIIIIICNRELLIFDTRKSVWTTSAIGVLFAYISFLKLMLILYTFTEAN